METGANLGSARRWLRVLTVATPCMMPLASGAASSAQQSDSTGAPANDPALRDYYSANGLLNRGMHELAAPEYRRFLQNNPDHEKAPLARYGLAVCLFRMQKMEEAIAELNRIEAGDGFPFAVEVSLMKGQGLMAKGDYEAAAKTLERAARSTHDLADDAAALRIEALVRAKSPREAQTAAEQFAVSWPDSGLLERVRLFQASALVAMSEDGRAIGVLQQMLDAAPTGALANRGTLMLAQCFDREARSDEAARRYQQVIDAGADQTLPEALAGLAEIQSQQRQSARAGELLNRLVAEFPTHPATAGALLLRGKLAIDQQNYKQAIADFERFEDANGDRADEAQFWIAKCELRNGKPAQAAQRLKKAIDEHPQSEIVAEMCYDRAIALSRTDQKQTAIGALNDFCKRFPRHALEPEALYLQAALEHEQGRYDASIELCREFAGRVDENSSRSAVEFLWAENEFLTDRPLEAIKRYEQFIHKHPGDARISTAHMRMGTALYQLEEYEKAAVVLKPLVDGVRTAPANLAALLMLGDIALRAENWQASAQWFDDYLSFGDDQPSVADAHFNRALALKHLDRGHEAIESLDKVISLTSDGERHTQAMFEKGQILLASDDDAAAAAMFEQVVKADSKSPLALRAMNHLAALAARDDRPEEAAAMFARVAGGAGDEALKAQAMFQQGQSLMTAGKLEEAAQALDRFATQWPTHELATTARAQQAIAQARLNHYEDAIKTVDAVDAAAMSQLDATLRITLMYEQAWCLRELKRPNDAQTTYSQLLGLPGNHELKPAAALELAELQIASGNRDAAQESLARLVSGGGKLLPDVRERAMHRLATCQFDGGQFENCAATMNEFLAAFPQSKSLASALVLAGESQFQLGRHSQAAKHFEALTAQFPEDPAVASSLLRLGECYASLGRWKESGQAYQAHREKYADSELWFAAQFGIAWALENQGETDSAMTAYRLVTDGHNGPTAARAQFQIGECLFAQRKHEDAVRELLKVDILYAYPEWSAAALYEAGRCFDAMGQTENARVQFQRVQTDHRGTTWAKLAEERLAAARPKTS